MYASLYYISYLQLLLVHSLHGKKGKSPFYFGCSLIFIDFEYNLMIFHKKFYKGYCQKEKNKVYLNSHLGKMDL